MLVGSVMAYGSLIDPVFQALLPSTWPNAAKKVPLGEAQELVGTTVVIYLVLGSILFAILRIVALFFSRPSNVPPWCHSTAMSPLTLAGLRLAVAIPNNSTLASIGNWHSHSDISSRWSTSRAGGPFVIPAHRFARQMPWFKR
jgi:hypothetical protein